MRIAIILTALLLLAASALRAEENELQDCGQSGSTVDIVQCLATRTAVWDRRLNTAYRKLLTTVPVRQRERLRAAQRLWIQYRDANCAYYATGQGTISRVEAGECMRSMTEPRPGA